MDHNSSRRRRTHGFAVCSWPGEFLKRRAQQGRWVLSDRGPATCNPGGIQWASLAAIGLAACEPHHSKSTSPQATTPASSPLSRGSSTAKPARVSCLPRPSYHSQPASQPANNPHFCRLLFRYHCTLCARQPPATREKPSFGPSGLLQSKPAIWGRFDHGRHFLSRESYKMPCSVLLCGRRHLGGDWIEGCCVAIRMQPCPVWNIPASILSQSVSSAVSDSGTPSGAAVPV